ncbi:MAG: TetR/AcrR family transcriptional regulator C-terminal domain-containing protein [Alphaproteobacteria bacterium]|nr:TetR/AcrR family transcriptional regulator C-terminal domain-containing protein [Alphaproteobacteria bacterium]
MPAKPRFTRAQLQTAALALVDAQGLAALSMRTLAAAIGTGPMTLYNYVRDRDELDALLVEAVLAEAHWPVARGDWQQDVRAITNAMWQAVRAHPQVIPLILTRRSLQEATLAPAEALLEALAASGRSGAALLAAFRTVTGFVMGLAQAQLPGPAASSGEAGADPVVARMRALPADRFPRLVEIAHAATRIGPAYELRSGLDIILAGLAASAPRVRRGKLDRA